MAKRSVRVIWFRVGEHPQVVEIKDDIEEMQRLVGGWVERVRISCDVDLWCHEEGLLERLPLNVMLLAGRSGPTPICGNFFLARHEDTIEGQDIASVTDEDVSAFTSREALS